MVSVTAKERLREMVDELSEERAAHWCERLAREERPTFRPSPEGVAAWVEILSRPRPDADPDWTADDLLRSLEENPVSFRVPTFD